MSRETDFPNLRPGGWRQCSAVDWRYNCIAFAAGRTDVYWWPDPFPDPLNDYWPPGIPREETVNAIADDFNGRGVLLLPKGAEASVAWRQLRTSLLKSFWLPKIVSRHRAHEMRR